MFIVQHSRAAQGEQHSPAFIPMVYDHVAAEPTRWEYHILTIDSKEQHLPIAETLNTLGVEGWLLVSLLDERVSQQGSLLHYYFVRQAQVA
ncbi:hypothetical protein [Tengunoibacter tsumagoiensis]|uniref:DUF4177 domain-containing protein n=1 Tax=Tengunoibacter tsumagoiensis TaxID=2014871 RepID=A0A401ZZV1_9CHLR|nr:hypothetical protein [Tengunoibacter tsumagoiensis]GCE12356.1 hypothetical protein KTT_22150 [Tengunoibacter tsumagoiensis]